MAFIDHYTTIKDQIVKAESRSLRPNGGVTLVAVSKMQPPSKIREALDFGHRIFGENRVQEARLKFQDLKLEFPDLILHLIGSLQSNKAEEAVKLFDVIETLDRPSLAEALKKAVIKLSKTPRFMIEVNIGHESQKAGVLPDQLPSLLDFCQYHCGLVIDGLMCIPPHNKDPVPYFKELVSLAERAKLPKLSMGMSEDFEAAIEWGSTEIRLGTALFGKRSL